MDRSDIKMAMTEAERFLVKAQALLDAQDNANSIYEMHPKESGACRRASMDLTRALAEMRRVEH